MGRTSIIIPSHNGEALLRECVQSIRSYTSQPYEIIVVDNGSTDGSLGYCRSEELIFVSSAHRLGFPEACNLGLRIASGDALVLLNNDVLVTPNWLDNMLRCLDSGRDIGIVGPLTNYASGEQQITISYRDLHEMTVVFNRPDPAKWRQTKRIVGLCMLFRRSLMDEIGMLDERYSPGHYEDDDFCHRAATAGYRLMIAGDVYVHHHGSASFGREDQKLLKRIIAVNRQRFIEKWGIEPQVSI